MKTEVSRMAATLLGSWMAFSVVACGSGDGSSFGGGSQSDSKGNGQGASFDTEGTNRGAGDIDPASVVGNECAGTHAGLNGLPLRLVVVLDRSSSMNSKIGKSSDTKWVQAQAALNNFFASTQSSGITIDLIPFPSAEEKSVQCDPAQYQATTQGATVTLPDSKQSLSTVLASMPRVSGTPTRPALEGAIAYAKDLQEKLAGKETVSIILATDGEPSGCSANKVDDVASTVAAVKETIKTYVVGLGDNLDNLNTIAAGAATNGGKAFLVTSASPSVTDDLTKAFGTIRAAALTCNYAIPAAPEGKALDFNQVNVVYGTEKGKTLVKHSAGCADASGWRYDDENAPTQILLCGDACATVKGDTVVSLDVVLGCATNDSVPVN